MFTTFTVHVTCGNGRLSPSCELCPKHNDTQFTDWCGGNCNMDETNGICKEKGKFCYNFISNLVFNITFNKTTENTIK